MIELAKILVSGVDTRVIELEPIPEKISGATVRFAFDDPMWDGLIRNAVFVGSRTVSVLNVGDTAEIPMEAVSRHGPTLRVGICGTAADGKVVIPTLYANLGPIRPAADPGADPSANPALPVWAQLQTEIEKLKQDGPDVDLSGYVKSVNGKTPDEKGNVEIDIPDSGGNADYGEENSGKLLYVGADGTATPIALGDGLEITVGTGKNLVKEEWENARYAVDGSYLPLTTGLGYAMLKGKVTVTPGATYTGSFASLNGVTWANAYIAEYKANGEFIRENNPGSVATKKKFTFTVGSETTQIYLYFYSDGAPWETIIPNNFMLEVGDTATEYEPFTNTEPCISVKGSISGEGDVPGGSNVPGSGVDYGAENAGRLLYVDENGITSTLVLGDGLTIAGGAGKNLVKEEWENARYLASGEYFAITSGKDYAMLKGKIDVTPGETYTCSFSGLNGATWANAYIAQYRASGEFIGEIRPGNVATTKKFTFTVDDTATQIYLYFYSSGNAWETIIPNNFMMEVGSNATDYEPYLNAARIKIANNVHAATASYAESISDMAYAEHSTSLTVKSIAHRGAPGNAPECTAHAYILAKKLGFTVAENDVALTSDGQYVMWHDVTLAKLGNNVYDLDSRALMKDASGNFYWQFDAKIYVYNVDTNEYVQDSSVDKATLTAVKGSELTVAEQPFWLLRLLDVGRWKDGAKFASTQMLTFAEWIQLCKDLGMECYIDQKFSFTEAQAVELVSIVRRKGMLRKCSWLGSLENVRKADPKARCGVLTYPNADRLVENGVYDKALKEGGEGSVFWNPSAADVTAENAIMALDAGYGFECWYVDVPASVTNDQYYAEIERVLQCGCQNLTLDNHTVNDYMMYKYGSKLSKA